jgi:integrase
MARPSTGQVVVRDTKGGRKFALRFTAYGKRRYVTLGTAEDGWTRDKAEAELRHVLADCERGIWQPASPEPVKGREPTSFHVFASRWLAERTPELRPKTVESYTWVLTHHLLPFFASFDLTAIDPESVDRYKTKKLREGIIGPNQINKTLTLLAQILDAAVEYDYMDRNPAAGKRRRVKATKPRRSWVEPEQLPAFLEAAGARIRPLVATLAGAGLRVGEACALDWRDVNLSTGTLTIGASKTDAGLRTVDLPAGLHEELLELKARSRYTAPSDPVFTTRGRGRQTPSNVGRRLKPVIRHANDRLAKLDIEPISERVTPHSLRRTYISVRAVLGDSPVTIAEQVGHTDPTFTLRVYAKATRRPERLTGSYRSEFQRACEWARVSAPKGTSSPQTVEAPTFLPADLASNPAP